MAESRAGNHLLRRSLAAIPAFGLAAGSLALFGGAPGAAGWIFAAATAPVLLVLLVDVWRGFRGGEFGLDLLAALSMGGALALGEPLAGAIVALMFAGGQLLEEFARERARREMAALLGRVARTAARHGAAGLEEVAVEAVRTGDRLLIRRGEVVPVDGRVLDGRAVLDQAALTGEPLPVRLGAGDAVPSGVTNAGEAFDLRTVRAAADSTYAGIVRLVEAAQRSKAPMGRLADRYALGFLALTLAIAGAAWFGTDDPVRALAVLVVATPCPLILAVPVAVIAGMSRAAGRGMLVKSAGALEALARVRTLLLDKTGTLTEGRARLEDVRAEAGFAPEEVLRLAASLDQASHHVMAEALVAAARVRGLALVAPSGVREAPGDGIEGLVEGRVVAVGGFGFAARRAGRASPPPADGGAGGGAWATPVYVAVDGALAGVLRFADPIRKEAADMLRGARAAGIARVVLVTGDSAEAGGRVGRRLGLDGVLFGQTPRDKVAAVAAERARGGGPVAMVGDGVNDAAALAAADVGVAMGARGGGAAAEAADAVLLVDRLDRLTEAMGIARRSRAIALQSVAAGMGLSAAGMAAAAFGHLTPVQGALLQEAIDVAVVLNALRALGGGGAAPEGAPGR